MNRRGSPCKHGNPRAFLRGDKEPWEPPSFSHGGQKTMGNPRGVLLFVCCFFLMGKTLANPWEMILAKLDA